MKVIFYFIFGLYQSAIGDQLFDLMIKPEDYGADDIVDQSGDGSFEDYNQNGSGYQTTDDEDFFNDPRGFSTVSNKSNDDNDDDDDDVDNGSGYFKLDITYNVSAEMNSTVEQSDKDSNKEGWEFEANEIKEVNCVSKESPNEINADVIEIIRSKNMKCRIFTNEISDNIIIYC
ncbi:uncharacterized protein LOC130899728 [Diorhabda carinulata]|uniref:uncharacterized protein LOC130899728 n=1 Tax=Diorhabda carinulata TaxID=1163345 RepID=UPI0025A261D1|nr:uncharacterized protein LOC130899728 [Diorhabda carinulata]